MDVRDLYRERRKLIGAIDELDKARREVVVVGPEHDGQGLFLRCWYILLELAGYLIQDKTRVCDGTVAFALWNLKAETWRADKTLVLKLHAFTVLSRRFYHIRQ